MMIKEGSPQIVNFGVAGPWNRVSGCGQKVMS